MLEMAAAIFFPLAAIALFVLVTIMKDEQIFLKLLFSTLGVIMLFFGASQLVIQANDSFITNATSNSTTLYQYQNISITNNVTSCSIGFYNPTTSSCVNGAAVLSNDVIVSNEPVIQSITTSHAVLNQSTANGTLAQGQYTYSFVILLWTLAIFIGFVLLKFAASVFGKFKELRKGGKL